MRVALWHAGVVEGLAMSRVSQFLWVPQLLGEFLFALGFLQLARTTEERK